MCVSQLVKTTKPTGDGVCPLKVSWAHEIDQLINECAGTCDVNDTDLKDDEDNLSSSAHGSPDPPQPLLHTTVPHSVATNAPVPRRYGPANELLSRISGDFDPDAIKAQDDKRANRTLANTHFLTQSQQLRNVQAATKKLHDQVLNLHTRLNNAECAHNKAELHIEMFLIVGPGWNSHVRKLIYDRPKAK